MIRRRALCVRRLGGGIEVVMGWGVVVLGCCTRVWDWFCGARLRFLWSAWLVFLADLLGVFYFVACFLLDVDLFFT